MGPATGPGSLSFLRLLSELEGLDSGFDPRTFDALLQEFTSLPVEEQKALMGLAGMVFSPWEQLTEGIAMPPAPPVDPAALDAARAMPALASFAAIREFVAGGRKLTAKGNLTVADVASLAQALGDPGWRTLGEAGRAVRSADDLPYTQFLIRWARAAGALRVERGRLISTASWAKLSPLAAAAKAAGALLTKGPLGLEAGEDRWGLHVLDSVIDEGVVHLMALLWAGSPMDFEILLEAVTGACDALISWEPQAEAFKERRYRLALDRLVDLLSGAGLLTRDDAVEEEAGRSATPPRRGGTVSLTVLGRAVVGPYLNDHGYDIPVSGALAGGPLADLFARMAEWHPAHAEAEFDLWVDRHGVPAAIEELAGCVAGGYSDPQWPLVALHLASRLPSPHDEAAVRRLADTPARGHALGWLVERGHDVDLDRDAFMVSGVELLAMTYLEEPDGFLASLERIGDLGAFIAECARVPGPHAGLVLGAIAEVHPDPAVATAARRAAMRRGSKDGAGRAPAGAPGSQGRRQRRSKSGRRHRR